MFFQRAQSPHPSRLGGIQIFSDSEGRFLLFPVIRSRSGPSHILAAVKTLSPPLTAPELGTALLALWDRWEGTPCWEELPPELLPLMLVRPISGSAALGVGADLINTYGPDSDLGRMAAVMLGSTETTFYTIAVYFGAVGITRTRYAVPAALCADLTGFLAASWAVGLLFGG